LQFVIFLVGQMTYHITLFWRLPLP